MSCLLCLSPLSIGDEDPVTKWNSTFIFIFIFIFLPSSLVFLSVKLRVRSLNQILRLITLVPYLSPFSVPPPQPPSSPSLVRHPLYETTIPTWLDSLGSRDNSSLLQPPLLHVSWAINRSRIHLFVSGIFYLISPRLDCPP